MQLAMDSATVPVPSGHYGPSGPLEGIMDRPTRASDTRQSSAGQQGAATAAQCCSASMGVTSSALEQCYGGKDSGRGPWLNGSRGCKARLHRAGGGAPNGSLGPELASVRTISAPRDRAQPKALAFVTGLNNARSSAMGSELGKRREHGTSMCTKRGTL